MKIYATHCYIPGDSWAISYHMDRGGAEIALAKHKAKEKVEWDERYKDRWHLEPMAFDEFHRWRVVEIEVEE